VIVVGVDPGKEGAVARLSSAPPTVCPMPLIEGGKRDEYDIPNVARLLVGASFVFVEKLQTLPPAMGGGIANFNRGYCMGMFSALCMELSIPVTFVAPREWQREMLAGTSGDDTKQRSIIAAQRLFPGVCLLRTLKCKKPSDGIADALLVAEYGRRWLARR
jgi:hypothetical protein